MCLYVYIYIYIYKYLYISKFIYFLGHYVYIVIRKKETHYVQKVCSYISLRFIYYFYK